MSVSVSKVGHLVLRVRDLDRSLAFYCGNLGLREVARRDFGEGPMAWERLCRASRNRPVT